MQDRRSSVSESVLVEVFFVGKAVFRNAGALHTAFPRRSVGTIIKYNEKTNFLFTTKTRRARRKNKRRVIVVNFKN